MNTAPSTSRKAIALDPSLSLIVAGPRERRPAPKVIDSGDNQVPSACAAPLSKKRRTNEQATQPVAAPPAKRPKPTPVTSRPSAAAPTTSAHSQPTLTPSEPNIARSQPVQKQAAATTNPHPTPASTRHLPHTQSTGIGLRQETSLASTIVTTVVDSESEMDDENIEVVKVPEVDDEELLSKCFCYTIEKWAHHVA